MITKLNVLYKNGVKMINITTFL